MNRNLFAAGCIAAFACAIIPCAKAADGQLDCAPTSTNFVQLGSTPDGYYVKWPCLISEYELTWNWVVYGKGFNTDLPQIWKALNSQDALGELNKLLAGRKCGADTVTNLLCQAARNDSVSLPSTHFSPNASWGAVGIYKLTGSGAAAVPDLSKVWFTRGGPLSCNCKAWNWKDSKGQLLCLSHTDEQSGQRGASFCTLRPEFQKRN